MSPPSVYLRPLGLLSGPDAHARVAAGDALPLAGGWLAFTALERIRRLPGAEPSREVLPVTGLSGLDGESARTLARLTAPRGDFAGLSMDRPHVMGILNATPDSFSDGGVHFRADAAIASGRRMAEAGATVLDVGGESTRPGAEPVSEAEELARVVPVLEGLQGVACLSLDSRNAPVMAAGLEAGARILNDVSALTHDPRALAVAARAGAPVVLMHASGDPKVMQSRTDYADVVLDIYDYLAGRIAACEAAGLPRASICVDPGIGFGKTRAQNHALLRDLALFHGLGCPILLGASRKSFLSDLPGGEAPTGRLGGSLAAALQGLSCGVQILRVHDVEATAQAAALHMRLHAAA